MLKWRRGELEYARVLKTRKILLLLRAKTHRAQELRLTGTYREREFFYFQEKFPSPRDYFRVYGDSFSATPRRGLGEETTCKRPVESRKWYTGFR
jgi:hypothetical protein